jgi:hypothetical protein
MRAGEHGADREGADGRSTKKEAVRHGSSSRRSARKDVIAAAESKYL